jgi:very-short-patch-repair endonuclease
MKDHEIGKMHVGAENHNFEFAKKLRRNQTKAEKRLWDVLRNRQLNDSKFRRQHPIGSFIVDFYCHQSKLVIELDGSIHNDTGQKEYDGERQAYLEKILELKVLRFENSEVFKELDDVLKIIRDNL